MSEDATAEVMIIRRCRVTDIDDIKALCQLWAGEEITPHFIAAGRGELTARLGDCFLVAESAGRIRGFVYGSIHRGHGVREIPEGASYLDVEALYVAPDHRGKNTGGRLLEEIVEKGVGLGANHFVVNAHTRDVDAVSRFFGDHGFKPVMISFIRKENRILID